MDGQPYVRSETHQHITTIEFYHPQGNSLPSKLLRELANEIHKAGIDFNTRVIVLRSAGEKAFCGGASFDELVAIKSKEEGTKFFSGFGQVINAMRKCPRMIIARVQGKCVGGGVGIVAAADYAIALEGAEVKLSELSLGFGPFVIAPAVQRKIGMGAFSALSIDATMWRKAEWALRKGLFSELHHSIAEVNEAVSRLAFTLAHSSTDAMAELKEVLWKGTEDWDGLLQERAENSGRLSMSDFSKSEIAKRRK